MFERIYSWVFESWIILFIRKDQTYEKTGLYIILITVVIVLVVTAIVVTKESIAVIIITGSKVALTNHVIIIISKLIKNWINLIIIWLKNKIIDF